MVVESRPQLEEGVLTSPEVGRNLKLGSGVAIYYTHWTSNGRNGGTIGCVSLELSESVECKKVVFDAMDPDDAGQLGNACRQRRGTKTALEPSSVRRNKQRKARRKIK